MSLEISELADAIHTLVMKLDNIGVEIYKLSEAINSLTVQASKANEE